MMVQRAYIIRLLYQVDKPNHDLQYDIGTDFCIEDPMNTSFHLTINCPLTQELLIPPHYQWSAFFNGISLEEISTIGISAHAETDTLTLSGIISVVFDQASKINITCEVSNVFGSDTEKTLISMCGKY